MDLKSSIFILVFSVLKIVRSQFDCYENEVFGTVINPCNACDIRGACPQEAEPGCDCLPGYFRNSEGACVQPEACDTSPASEFGAQPSRCGRNEVYNTCGSACPPTCDNPQPQPCHMACVPGCFCKENFIRKGRICVHRSQCPVESSDGPPPGIVPRRAHYGRPPYLPPAYPPPRPPVHPPALPPPALPLPPAYSPPRPPVHPPALPPPPLPLPPAYSPPRPPPAYLPPPPAAYPPPPSPPLLPPALPPQIPPQQPPPLPPLLPPPPPIPPVLPPKPVPLDSRGCPNRNKCRKFCRSIGFVTGFCVGDRFMNCNCLS